MNAVVTVAPVVGISAVVLFKMLPMLIAEMEVPPAVLIPTVVARVIAMHIAVVVPVLSISRAGTKREGKYRD
jgi:hypothetical protein